MTQYRAIVVPTDFSPASEAALKHAIGLAPQLDCDLHVVHVWQLPVYTVPDGYFMLGAEATGRLVEGLEKSLIELKSVHAAPEVKLKTYLREGAPDAEVHRLVEELGAGLIVMGTHGRRGIAHALLGSIAEKIVRTSKVPVMVVPPLAQ
jgi:nucleotide-binding universal stress UspA family protein